MKNYGFTLIETMVSIFILTILFSVGVSLSKFGSYLSHDMENTAYVYEIQNLLSYGKLVLVSLALKIQRYFIVRQKFVKNLNQKNFSIMFLALLNISSFT